MRKEGHEGWFGWPLVLCLSGAPRELEKSGVVVGPWFCLSVRLANRDRQPLAYQHPTTFQSQATMDDFNRVFHPYHLHARALSPCYGLAESVVCVSW